MRRLLAAAALATLACVAPSTFADSPAFPPPRVAVRPAPAPRFEVIGDSSSSLPTFFQEGRRFVLGSLGERYRIRIVNPTPARVEAVVSVDGLDAVDGKPASLAKRGYVIPAFGDVTIDGWRTSLDTVAAFRFSSVPDSYASRTDHERNVGVIGVAFFRERPPIVWQPPPWASRGGAGGASDSRAAPSAAPSKSAEGLGTRFGESHDSRVVETEFVRADSSPMILGEVRYDDRDGLLARGIPVPPVRDGRWADLQRRDTAQPFAESRFAQPPR